jgi:hypothetical protein
MNTVRTSWPAAILQHITLCFAQTSQAMTTRYAGVTYPADYNVTEE